MKTIFIGTINRSGGSLLARLFDGHPDVASYPVEFNFPINNSLHPIFESYTGVPMTMPMPNITEDIDVYKLLDLPFEKPEAVLKWGKETGDPLGVRKNYLEKVFYGSVKTDFNFDKFLAEFEKERKGVTTFERLMAARHKAYFNAWDGGKHAGNMKFVIWHASSGIYLTNIGEYLKSFEGSSFINVTRDVLGHIASEKTRLTRRYYGSRRFPKIKMPNYFVKTFGHYDLEAHIRSWMVALTRIVLLQERIGADGRFVVCRYENLVSDTEKVMKVISDKTGLEYNPILLDPTIGGQPWTGNSHQGKQSGINRELSNYYSEVLSPKEISIIEKATGPVREYLDQFKETPADLTKIPKKHLLDYDYQRSYFDDGEKISLYYAFVNSGRRKMMVKTPDISAMIAYLYAKIIHFIHIPRMLKLKLFPGLGRQNYT